MKSSYLFLICLFAAALVSRAITFKTADKTCGICGHTVHVTTVDKFTTLGGMDLDTRPAPERRDTLKYQIQFCEKCGYCWPDITKTRKHEKISAILGVPIKADDLAALFARAAEIEIADNAPSFASFMLYLKAAWVMDDLKDKQKSDAYRRLASAQIEKYMARDAIARTTGDNYLIHIDICRRLGDFEKAKRLLEIAQYYAKESVLPQIVEFQRKLVDAKDTGRYTVEDALKTAK